MTSQVRSSYRHYAKYRLAYALAIAVMATMAVAGSVWSKDNGQRTTGNGQNTIRIDPSALLTSAEIANLPVLYIDEPF